MSTRVDIFVSNLSFSLLQLRSSIHVTKSNVRTTTVDILVLSTPTRDCQSLSFSSFYHTTKKLRESLYEVLRREPIHSFISSIISSLGSCKEMIFSHVVVKHNSMASTVVVANEDGGRAVSILYRTIPLITFLL